MNLPFTKVLQQEILETDETLQLLSTILPFSLKKKKALRQLHLPLLILLCIWNFMGNLENLPPVKKY